MLIDLKLAGKNVLIFGGGNIGEKKARKFSQANSKVTVVSKSFTDGLKQLSQRGKVKLVEAEADVNSPSTSSLISKSNLIIAATDNRKLNESIVKKTRKRGILVCAVDTPTISDFYLPAIAHVGKIRIAISTGGKSPAMARVLRKRVEELITNEDILQVTLQHYARKVARSRIPDKEARKNVLYQIIQDPNVKRLLKEGNLKEAKAVAKQIIERH
jgi:precorrin-2 dehydrogenase/sirohydrochlorin ferrochelatase